MPELTRDGDVHLLDLGGDENWMTPDWIASVRESLTAVATSGAGALVTTASGRFYSNGLEIERLRAGGEATAAYLEDVERLYAELLTLPLITVAAVQGHAFGGGAMLALAHDSRVMRADRGFWCLPEVSLGIPFTSGMTALVRDRLDTRVAHEAMVTSRRYGGTDALRSSIVDRAVPEDEVLTSAIELARAGAGLAGEALRVTKMRMYAATVERLGTRD